MDLKEKVERVQEFRLIDDVFFEAFIDDIPACQEILRTILNNEQLIVKSVVAQKSEKNLYGRSVRLDALCEFGNGSKCNIEVQRANNDNHLKRARYNASVITTKESDVGQCFDDVLDLYIIYISEFDFLGGGLTIYHVDKTIRENGVVIDDGLHEIFVNTKIKDGSPVSALMTCFISKEVNDPKFPAVTKRFNELKSEGGAPVVCNLMERYFVEERADERAKTRLEAIQNMLELGVSKDKIMKKYSPEEIEEAERQMLLTV